MAPDQPVRAARKARRLVVAAVAATVAIAVPLALRGGDEQDRPASVPKATGVAAHPEQSPPQELIAAGRIALSAYFTRKLVEQSNGNAIGTYEWRLLNTATKRYGKTDWAWLDVAPGMRTAAVLERDLPVTRVGLLDLTDGKVQRWIKLGKSVGGVEFSPNGKYLLATTYSLNPDGLFKDASYRLNDRTVPGPKPSRTGFYVIDVASGTSGFAARPAEAKEQGGPTGGRQDFHWSPDGKLVWEPGDNAGGQIYYDLTGKKREAPDQGVSPPSPGAVLSPDGNLMTGDFVGEGDRIVSEIRNVKTGKRASVVPGQQLLVWADNSHVLAWRCDPKRCSPGRGEFRNQLLLVGLDGEATPLSGFRSEKLRDNSRWNPIFTAR